VDGEGGDIPGAVQFEPFTGVSPRLYSRVFRYRRRKNPYGSVVHWNNEKAMPQGAGSGEAYLTIEANKSAALTTYRQQYQEFKASVSAKELKEGNENGQSQGISSTGAKGQRENKGSAGAKKDAPTR
jgi:hypothetical protein